MCLRMLLIVLAGLLVAAAPSPPTRISGDLMAMQGTWVQVEREAWGRWHGCWGGGCIIGGRWAEGKETWIIEGDRLTWRSEWAVRLTSGKRPAEIDLVRTSRLPALRRRGLYKVEGDTLSVSLSEGERPKTLGGSKDVEGDLIIFRRQKP